MKRLSVLLILFLAIPGRSAARQDSERDRMLMDYGWRFTTGDPVAAEAPGFDDSGWRLVDLPHDWSIEGSYDENAATTGRGGYLPTGVGWYRRTFAVNPGTRRVWIEFDGVQQNSDVWVNGIHVGHRPYGYIGFMYDVTAHLVDGTNVVAVRVDNSRQPNSRWYTGSGIYRHVWMSLVPSLHVAHRGTTITTPSVDSSAATVSVRTRIVNEGTERRRVRIWTWLSDVKWGRQAGGDESHVELGPGAESVIEQRLQVLNPALWSPDTPFLYTLHQDILGEGGGDRLETIVGIRSIAFDKDRGFLLNGEPVKMLGVNLHHDGGPVGAAVPEAVWARRFRLLKEMGANAIRTAHNPMAPEFMDLADEMGFLVMNEAFDEWTHGKVEYGYHVYFDEWSERDLTDFIRRDRNHPSIVLWSMGNEIGEQHAPGGEEVLRRLREIAKREDPTRPITTGNDHIAADDGATTVGFRELLDVIGYNYVDRWHERRELYAWPDRQAFPDWKHIGTESGSVRGTRGEYSLGNDPERPNPFYTRSMINAEQLWKFVSLNDWFAGDFMWTGIDYLGESRWPRKSSTSGVLDLVGFPDDGYWFYRSRWTDEPMLHLFPHWNWEGREGQTIPVIAYTNVDAVELYLNDRFIGEKVIAFPRQGTSGCWNCYDPRPVFPTTADLHMTWDVPFEPGTLRAVGKRAGEAIITREIRTTGPPAALRLTSDRAAILSNTRDVAHVQVEVVDAAGHVVPTAAVPVTFEVTGSGRLLAVGNGNPTDHSPFRATERTTFNGLAMAFIQSGTRAGMIRVTATGEGLAEATIEVEVTPRIAPRTVPHGQ